MYIAIDDGPTTKDIAEEDKEIYEWVNVDNVYNKLSYGNLKDFWIKIKNPIKNIFKNNGSLSPDILRDLEIE